MSELLSRKRSRVKTKRFDSGEFENMDMLLLQQAVENSKRETKRINVSAVVPEAPTFYPSMEEFKNPLKYISSIQSVAMKYGICKIVPPMEWNPPMNIDMQDERTVPTKLQKLAKLQEGNNVFPDGRSYNIGDYKNMADKAREEWINSHHIDPSSVSYEELATDYWNIVETSSMIADVEYANDLDTTKYTSGFPRVSREVIDASRRDGTSEDMTNPNYYATTDWNLNNIPNAQDSLLKVLEAPTNGVNVPWLYLGSLFTTFCWHVEDNYLYSINYSHFGDVKQWYGVPSYNFDSFEKVSKAFYRESFMEAPDMLQYMTTQISVSALITSNIPVYHVRQDPRTFVITFPKAFHCGFSYGFNCGEAVNFALPSWLPFGGEADYRYRTSEIPRQSVFSHSRLLFTLLNSNFDQLDVESKKSLLTQVLHALQDEIDGRKTAVALRIPDVTRHIPTAQHNDFSVIDNKAADYDDQRMCALCKQVCLFSAVGCNCSCSKVTCARHHEYLCLTDKPDTKQDKAKSKKHRKFLISWALSDDLKKLLLDYRKILSSL